MALTKQERNWHAITIVDAMQEAYEEEGEEGDFDDARRHYREDASDEEILADLDKWVNKK